MYALLLVQDIKRHWFVTDIPAAELARAKVFMEQLPTGAPTTFTAVIGYN